MPEQLKTEAAKPLRSLSHPLYNLPNQLTAARLVLGVALFVLIAVEQWMWCILVFALAAVTDYLDGYFARKQGIASSLGRVFDPLVDKVLICGAYIFVLGQPFVRTGLAAWMVTIVVARELIINGLRSFFESRGVSFGADWLGKIKMALQCAALFGVFSVLQCEKTGQSDGVVATLAFLRNWLIYLMLLATALSGLQYLWRAALIFQRETED
ncbi:MAG: hypothetical protein KatS3mg105_3941 [Gemmatales bacterium]|nr:MAG: hypothetical protein KatS3mg105_3941 [Gemmatales bacterium]